MSSQMDISTLTKPEELRKSKSQKLVRNKQYQLVQPQIDPYHAPPKQESNGQDTSLKDFYQFYDDQAQLYLNEYTINIAQIQNESNQLVQEAQVQDQDLISQNTVFFDVEENNSLERQQMGNDQASNNTFEQSSLDILDQPEQQYKIPINTSFSLHSVASSQQVFQNKHSPANNQNQNSPNRSSYIIIQESQDVSQDIEDQDSQFSRQYHRLIDQYSYLAPLRNRNSLQFTIFYENILSEYFQAGDIIIDHQKQ